MESTQEELLDLVIDAGRFVRFGRDGIQEAPLQVYCSVLMFAPRSSKVKQMFDRRIPWIDLRPEVAQDWDARLIEFTNHESADIQVRFSVDGTRVASGDDLHNLIVWVCATGAVLSRATLGGIECFDVSCKDLLAFGNAEGEISIWRNMERKNQRVLCGHEADIALVLFSPDGEWLASFDNKGVVMLWEVSTDFRRVMFHPGSTGYSQKMAFSSRRDSGMQAEDIFFATATEDLNAEHVQTTITLWRKRQGVKWELLLGFTRDGKLVGDPTFSHATLLCALVDCWTGMLEVVECEVGSNLKELQIRAKHIEGSFLDDRTRLVFLTRPQPDQSQLACIVCDGIGPMQLYELAGCDDERLVPVTMEFEESNRAIKTRLSPDGSLIAASKERNGWSLWKTDTGESVASTAGFDDFNFTFAPLGSTLIAANHGSIQLWDINLLRRQHARRRIQNLPMNVRRVDESRIVSADGLRAAVPLFVSDTNGTIDLYDLSTAQTAAGPLKILQPSSTGVSNRHGPCRLLFSSSRSWLAFRYRQGLDLWHLDSCYDTANPTRSIKVPWGPTLDKYDVVFSLDERAIACRDASGTVLVSKLDSRNADARRVYRCAFDSRFLSLTASKSRFYVTCLGPRGLEVFECGFDTNSALVYWNDGNLLRFLSRPIRTCNVIYSPDRNMFAVLDSDNIHIFNCSSSCHHKSFRQPVSLAPRYEWCNRNCCLLSDKHGSFRVNPRSSSLAAFDPCNQLPFSLSGPPRSDWILWMGQPLLWLPLDYCKSMLSFHNNTLGMRLLDEPTWLRFGPSTPTFEELVEKQPLDTTKYFQEMTEEVYDWLIAPSLQSVRDMELQTVQRRDPSGR